MLILWLLNQPCTTGVTATGSWCGTLCLYCQTWFALCWGLRWLRSPGTWYWGDAGLLQCELEAAPPILYSGQDCVELVLFLPSVLGRIHPMKPSGLEFSFGRVLAEFSFFNRYRPLSSRVNVGSLYLSGVRPFHLSCWIVDLVLRLLYYLECWWGQWGSPYLIPSIGNLCLLSFFQGQCG